MTLKSIVFVRFLLLVLTMSQVKSVQKSEQPNLEAFKNCPELKKVEIYRADDVPSDEYDRLNYQWNIRLNKVNPFAIVVVKNAKEVGDVIKCAKNANIRVIAKSGSHSYEKYSYGDSQTIVIDLEKLNKVKIDRVAQTADVEAGVLLGQLYWEIWNNGGFGFPAGSSATLGAGQSLGGGFGVLSKRFGLSLDNILEMEFVGADGLTQIVSSTENPDLFWALCGAGAGNFGIVTKFKYKIFHVSTLDFKTIKFKFSPPFFGQVFESWNMWSVLNPKSTAYGVLVFKSDLLSVTFIDADLSEEDLTDVFNNASSTDVTTHTFIDLITSMDDTVKNTSDLANARREDIPKDKSRSKSYFISKSPATKQNNLFVDLMTRIPQDVRIKFNSYGGMINLKRKDETAYVHRDALYLISVKISSERKGVVIWVNEFDQLMTKVIDNGESGQNRMDGQLANFLERYYGTNLPRLVEIKRQVDPNNYFKFPQSIPTVL